MYNCKNYRPNINKIQMPGAGYPHECQIIADLYDSDGKFYRSAVVSDFKNSGLSAAKIYCDKKNKTDIESSPKGDSGN